MNNIFNPDFVDFITCFNNNNVKYVLVGGYAVILHGYRRTTGDLDLLLERTAQNYNNILKAFADFGMSINDMSLDSFLSSQFDVFTYGRAPSAIDIMTEMKGFTFEEVYKTSTLHNVGNLDIRTIHLNTLLTAKKISGRHKDFDDIENLDPQS